MLFVDEIHRFNRAQQDGFLPFVEDGTVTLVGATTENPSFELNAALLSRAQVLILHRLDAAALAQLLDRAEAIAGRPLPLDADARAPRWSPRPMATGASCSTRPRRSIAARLDAPLDPAGLGAFLQRRVAVYDKDREGHYNLISALHKCLRGSDPQAALYYMARMLTAGEEPLYVLRRLVRFASRTSASPIPQALVQCLAAKDAYDFLGIARGRAGDRPGLPLPRHRAQIERRLCRAEGGVEARSETGSLMPPTNILNAPTKLMKDIGYGKGYAYDHDADDGFLGRRLLARRTWRRRPSTSRSIAGSRPSSGAAGVVGRAA